jgi:hypothetical protein
VKAGAAVPEPLRVLCLTAACAADACMDSVADRVRVTTAPGTEQNSPQGRPSAVRRCTPRAVRASCSTATWSRAPGQKAAASVRASHCQPARTTYSVQISSANGGRWTDTGAGFKMSPRKRPGGKIGDRLGRHVLGSAASEGLRRRNYLHCRSKTGKEKSLLCA